MTEVIDTDLFNVEFVKRDSLIENDNTKMNYKNFLNEVIELCNTVFNDPKLAKSTYFLLHE